MGAPMAANLVKAGHQVTGFDIVAGRAEALAAKGGRAAATPAEAAAAGEIVITMLPAGPEVRVGLSRRWRGARAVPARMPC